MPPGYVRKAQGPLPPALPSEIAPGRSESGPWRRATRHGRDAIPAGGKLRSLERWSAKPVVARPIRTRSARSAGKSAVAIGSGSRRIPNGSPRPARRSGSDARGSAMRSAPLRVAPPPSGREGDERERVKSPPRRRLAASAASRSSSFHEKIGGDRTTLRHVLHGELERGRVERHANRYVLNGGLPDDVKRALLSLGLADDRRSA